MILRQIILLFFLFYNSVFAESTSPADAAIAKAQRMAEENKHEQHESDEQDKTCGRDDGSCGNDEDCDNCSNYSFKCLPVEGTTPSESKCQLPLPPRCPDGLHSKCLNNTDCQKIIKNRSGLFVPICGSPDALCIKKGSDLDRKCEVPPTNSSMQSNWRVNLASVITANILKTSRSIKEFALENWISSLTDVKQFITGNYTFAQKYYNGLCYSVNGCIEENAFDYIKDNSRLNVNDYFVDENKVLSYQLPYDLLPYSLFAESSFNNYGARLGAEQMANNLIFDDTVKQLNMAKAKDLLALLFNDIDYYMKFYNSLFAESLINETTSKSYAERIPFLIAPIIRDEIESKESNPKISLLQNLEQESMRRFSSFKWKKKISSAHKLSLYREMAIMLSHKLNMAYRQDFILSKVSVYKVNQFLKDANKNREVDKIKRKYQKK